MPRGVGFAEKVRRDILKHRKKVLAGYGHLEDIPEPTYDPRKTLTMYLIERRFRIPIEDLLVLGNLNEVAELLNINYSTVSRWRLKLGLRDGK